MKSLSRSTALKIASVLSFSISAFSIIQTLPMLAQGADAVNQGQAEPPYIVLLISLMTSVVGIVAAYGAWKQQRWGIILTILVTLINGLSAAPGVLFAPQTFLWISATLTVILSVAIIVLCLWRDGKLATA